MNNFLQVPFHLDLLPENLRISKEMIQLLTQQSHAFKVCHQVLNYAYSIQKNVNFKNHVLFDGSKSGKTTLLVAVFFYYFFYGGSIPIIIQRNSDASRN